MGGKEGRVRKGDGYGWEGREGEKRRWIGEKGV